MARCDDTAMQSNIKPANRFQVIYYPKGKPNGLVAGYANSIEDARVIAAKRRPATIWDRWNREVGKDGKKHYRTILFEVITKGTNAMTKPTREQAYDEMLELISSLLGWYEGDSDYGPFPNTLFGDIDGDGETWAAATKRIHTMAREAKNTQPSAEVPSVLLCPLCGSSEVFRTEVSVTCKTNHFCNACSKGFWYKQPPVQSIQSAIASVVFDLESTQENRGNYDITSGHLISVLKLLAVAIDKEMAK